MSQSGTYISNTGPGGYVETLKGDVGPAVVPSGGNINVITGNSSLNSGSSILFSGSGSTLTLNVSDSLSNTIIGYEAGNASITGATNVGLGTSVFAALTSAAGCTAVGVQALSLCSTGQENTAVGNLALSTVVGGETNTAIGFHAGEGITNGDGNFFAGYYSGTNYTGSESFNVLIDSLGTVGDQNVLRIGEGTGNSAYELAAAYICGINGVNVGSVASVVSINGDQLGETVITAGTGITVTTGANTITISGSGTTNLTYKAVNHASSPYTVLTTDDYISADVTAGVVSILLPNAPATGKVYIVKDKVGLAATSNITVTTVGGAVTIDGATSFVMNTAYQAIQVIFNGTSYEIY